ncbi:MAG TPA: hypothetical protein VHJ38_10525, partial [Nitrososphaeraceae archaeon]|nr:hypothetical protein [Nitrososphaeraceae archaeon]
TRMKYINLFSKVVVPSYCNTCNSHKAFLVDIADYLKSVIKWLPFPSMHFSGNCLKCGNFLSTEIISLSFSSLMRG